MKRLLTFLTLLTVFIGVGWAETSSLIFTAKCNGSGTADDGTVWTVTSDGTETNFDSTKGIHYGTNSAKVQYIKLTTSGISGTITKVVVNASTASGVSATASVTVGGNAFGGDPQSLSTTATDYTFNGSASGEIVVTVTKPSKAAKALYVKSVVVTYTTGSSTPICNEPTFSPAAGTYYDPVNVTLNCATTGATIRYTLDGTNPTATTGTVYTSPISVTSTTTIKAIATATGYDPSSVASATYTIFTPETYTPTYEENFSDGFGDFYTKTVTNPGFDVWTTSSYQGKTYAKAAAYKNSTNHASESWLISPYINLANTTNPELSFSQAIDSHFGTIANEATLWVKENNATTWTQITINYPDAPTTGYTAFESQTINLSGYKNKIIQIAFKYISTTSNAGNWEVSDFKVKDSNPSAPSYYLVGSFNSWTESDACKFEESNGTYTLNNVTFDDANTTFKVIKIENGNKTWYGGTGGVDYNIHHTHHENLPMDGSQNYKIQSAGTTSFSFTVSNNTPGNLNVNREAKLYIKGDFNSWNEELMTATADGWTTSQTIAANNKFGFVDEFGQYRGKEWTIWSEHMNNGYEIPMETNGDYKMGIAGTYTLNVNSNLSKLFVNSVTGDIYTLVESAEDLVDGAQYVIMSKGLPTQGAAYAMAGQRNNNRAQTADPIAINSDKQIIINGQLDAEGNPVQVITLEGQTDAWYFNVGNGYLYASGSSTNNQLKTEAEIDEDNNAKATIVIDADAKSAAITFQGTSTNKYLRHNASSKLFACYGSAGSQQPVFLFKKGASVTPPSDQVATPVITPGSADPSNKYTVYGGEQEITITCATDGATIYYTTDGADPTTSSTPYAEPCYLTSNGGPMTVKAIAVKDGLDDSQIATSYYLFTSPVAPTFTPTATAQTGDFTVEISSEYEDGVIYYMLDPEGVPTANNLKDDGTVYQEGFTVSGEGTHRVYAIVELNGIKSSVASITYTITSGGTTGDGDYVKVTNAADLTDGEYLIVYEMEGTPIENGIVFDGSLSNLDTKPNSISEVVGINNFTIASSTEVDAAIFTITSSENGYSIKSASDKYIGGTSSSNTMTSSDDVIYNSISFDEDGNADIISNTSHLRYNTSDTRFRYFKSSTYASQQPIALYKKVENPVDEPTEVTLAELCETGEPGKLYTINNENGLLGVYSYGTSVWFKDEEQAVDYQNPTPTTGTYQYYTVVEKQLGINKSERDFAQNNWIEVVFPSEQDFTNKKYVRNLTGTYSCENGNPKLTLTVAVDEENDVTEVSPSDLAYELNPYMAVNFAGNQTYTNNGETKTFFFSQPKAQEYAQILWAVWNGTEFIMPTGEDNYYGFKGSFTINPELNANPISGLKTNSSYNFKAIIRKSASKAGPYEVYPTDLNPDVPTAINGVVVNGNVKSVKYVNVAGIVSDVPFQGVNIVVTEYTDGSRTTTKMLKK